MANTSAQQYPVGTKFMTRGKGARLCTVVDFYTTRNLAGEVVKTTYVASYEFCGQPMVDRDVCAVTIARGLQEGV